MTARVGSFPRYAPAIALPPYSYVPGHGLPHPVHDPAGHLYNVRESVNELPIVAATLADDPRWLYALDLFNAGFYWEAHEAWECFWHAFGRTSPDARFVQGLIHVAAAAVKIREGKPAGVTRHVKRARELLGNVQASGDGLSLGLDPESVSAVVSECETSIKACWHTSRTPVVRVLAGNLRLTAQEGADERRHTGPGASPRQHGLEAKCQQTLTPAPDRSRG